MNKTIRLRSRVHNYTVAVLYRRFMRHVGYELDELEQYMNLGMVYMSNSSI